MNPHPTLTIQSAGAGRRTPALPSGSRHGSDKTRDPDIERMLTAHVHCGEEMALIVADHPRETDTDAPRRCRAGASQRSANLQMLLRLFVRPGKGMTAFRRQTLRLRTWRCGER